MQSIDDGSRLDRLERRFGELDEHVRKLEVWQAECRRQLRELEELARRYVPIIEAMQRADAIAEAVAGKLDSRDERTLHSWGIRAAIASAVLAGVGELLRLAGIGP